MRVESNKNIIENFKYNFFVNVLDASFFGFGIGFASFSTILPLFVSQMTNSAVLIGLVPAIHNMFWQIPQLFMAKKVSSLPRIKPHVLLMTINERLPYLGFALIAWFLPVLNKSLALSLFFVLLIWQGLGAGLTANGWQSMLAKVIPSKTRARFFGVQSASANLFASGGALLAGLLLQKASLQVGYTLCFLIAFVMLLISMFFLGLTREPRVEKAEPSSNPPTLLYSVKTTLKKDSIFLGFLVSRTFFQFGMMSFAFYIVYGAQNLGMSTAYAGVMTSLLLITQVVSNPVLGWVADNWGHRPVLILGSLASMLSALFAWLATSLVLFPLMMVLSGIANTTFWTIGIAYTLEFGTDDTRPTYVGILNTLGAPAAILAPLLGGWLADKYSYSVTFLVSAGLSLLTAVILIGMGNYSKRKMRSNPQLGSAK
jgi:MFS family permease